MPVGPRTRGGSLRRYLGQDEETLLVTRQHPFALLRAALDCLWFLVPLLVAAWGVAGVEVLRGEPSSWLLRLLFVAMFVVVMRLAFSVLEWEFERVVVTGEKVIHISGVFARRIASTPLAKVSEFTVRQPLIGRLFDYGSLVVDVPGGRDQALHGLAYLPDPAGMYRLISDQARRGRVQEGGGRLQEDDDEHGRSSDALDVAGPTMSSTAGSHVESPSPEDLRRLHRPDPWQPALAPEEADHTIRIPRIPPKP